MQNKHWKKLSYYVGLLPIGALFGALVYIAHLEIKDFDLWLHLAMGKFIVTNGFVPSVDILSCSYAGNFWVNHEWLFQVVVYNLYNWFGFDGLINMQIVLVTLTMLILLFIGYSRDKQMVTTLTLALVFLVFQQRFTIRPDLYSLLFFAMYIYILALHIDKRWAPIGLFFIQIFWSNMHGFFFFGPLFIAIGILSEWIKRSMPLPYEWNDSGKLTDGEYKRLKISFVLVILATFLNPLFIKGAWYPLGVFFSLSGENKIFFDFIQELQKPVEWETLTSTSHFIYYKFLIVISFITFIFNRRRIDISAFFFWLVFLVFSLKAARNTSYFAFAAYLVIITNLMHVSYRDVIPIRFTDKKFLYVTSIVFNIVILVWVFEVVNAYSMRGYFDFDKYERKSEYGGVSLRSYPTKALDFLVDNDIKGNFFNDFNSGAYTLGRAFPNIKVFIDGRTEVYGGAFFKEYQDIWENGNSQLLEEKILKYGITGAILNTINQHVPEKLVNYFYKNEDWILVYFDYDGLIFLKNVEAHQLIIDEYAIDLSQWQPTELDLERLGPTKVLPYQSYYRAFTLESLGFKEAALAELSIAVEVAPEYAEAYHLTGKIYGRDKEYEKAFRQFRKASLYAPHNKQIRFNLALSYYDMGSYEEAIKQYEAIIFKWPKDPKGFFFLSRSLAKNEEYSEAKGILLHAHSMNDQNIVDILKIGDIIVEQKKYLIAKEFYEIGFGIKGNKTEVFKKIGQVYQAVGESDKALESFNRALLESPKDEELQNTVRELEVPHEDPPLNP